MKEKDIDHASKRDGKRRTLWAILSIAGALFVFLLSIDLIGEAFKLLGGSAVETFLEATDNPFIGLFMGLLVTAIIQSSSTTTSMIVAVVATGSLSLANAIPIVMGANIGTTITSTLVSLSFIANKKEFARAISAGSVHDFFNILVVLIIFPLEYYYQFLTHLSRNLTDLITPSIFPDSISFNIEGFILKDLSEYIIEIFPHNFIVLVLSFILLFASLKFLAKVIHSLLIGRSNDQMNQSIFENTYKSFGFGLITTAALQSSSVTTSLSVPLVATGKVKLEKLFPFIMGANIGTTVTALLAALYKSEAAISLALAHLIFNLVGVLIFLPFPIFRKIPIKIASGFGRLTLQNKIIGFAYIILTFFLIPFALIYFSN